MKIAICDDEEYFLDVLTDLIKDNTDTAVIDTFTNADDLLTSKQNYDIIFLDIEMRGTNGIEAADKLRARFPLIGQAPLHIFLTSFKGYSLDAFDVNAFNFILKPVDPKKFRTVFARACTLRKTIAAQEDVMLVKFQNGASYRLDRSHILYVESTGSSINIYTLDGKIQLNKSLKSMQVALGPEFYRCHKGFIVNLRMIQSYTWNQITLFGSTTVPLPVTVKKV